MKKNWLDVIAIIEAKTDVRFENHIPEILVIKKSESNEIMIEGNFIAKLLKPIVSILIFCKNRNGKSIMFFEKIFVKSKFAAFLALSISSNKQGINNYS